MTLAGSGSCNEGIGVYGMYDQVHLNVLNNVGTFVTNLDRYGMLLGVNHDL